VGIVAGVIAFVNGVGADTGFDIGDAAAKVEAGVVMDFEIGMSSIDQVISAAHVGETV
jgi:hypothetical protein